MNKLITVLLPFAGMSAAFVFTTTPSSVVQAAGCETASFGEAGADQGPSSLRRPAFSLVF